MIPAPSSVRLHLAAAFLLAVAAVVAFCAQTRRPVAAAPRVSSAAAGAPAAAQLLWGGRLDLNTAGADDLAALPGIGPVRAARIVAARQARAGGRFDRVADLLDVPGIGPATLAKLQDHVHVDDR